MSKMVFLSRSTIATFFILVCVFAVTVNSNERTNKKLKRLSPITSTEKTPDAVLDTLEEDNKKEEEKSDRENNNEENADPDLQDVNEKEKSDGQPLENEEKEKLGESDAENANEEEKEAEEKEKEDNEKEDNEEDEKKKPEEQENEDAVKTSDTEEKKESFVPDDSNSKESEASDEVESAPENSYAVWNSKGKICLLARLNATFAIVYPSEGGEQKAKVSLTHGKSKGKCESSTKSPLLQISWDGFSFTMMFNKSDEENWVVSSVEFTYDTSADLFDGATNVGKKTARSKVEGLFETPVGKSFFCPAQEVVLLYVGNKQIVTARLKDVHLQPYGIEDGKFSQFHRCNKVIIDGLDEAAFVQDETVPLAVGCTLALITLSILIGFAVHRAYNAAKVDYNNME